jgi:hypothetical protein
MSAGMPPSTPSGPIQSQRVAAGVLGILLGGLGLHRFIIGLVEGIIYTDQDRRAVRRRVPGRQEGLVLIPSRAGR